MDASKTVVVGLPAAATILTVQAEPGVQVTGPGISCPGDCTQEFPVGAKVALTASPKDAVFTSGCTGIGACSVLMDTSKTVVVGLPAAATILTVQAGPEVQVTGPGISCPGDCTQGFPVGAKVELTAIPKDAIFSGGCTGIGACSVLMNASKTVVVARPSQPVVLTVQATGAEVMGPGISCPHDCTQEFPVGAKVELTAIPKDAIFSVGCTGVGACSVLMNASKTVVVRPPPSTGTVVVQNDDPVLRITACSIPDVGSCDETPISPNGGTDTFENVSPGRHILNFSYGTACGGSKSFSVTAGVPTTVSVTSADCPSPG
jgi:hypothetical protein